MDADQVVGRRFRFSRRTLFAAATVVVLCGLLYTGKLLYDFQQTGRAEYITGQVIRAVGEFVSTHDGHWPQSWTDIPNGEYAQRYVRLRFDVDPQELIRDPELIHTVIAPVTGEYKIYPHAHRDLEELRTTLAEHRVGARQALLALVRALPRLSVRQYKVAPYIQAATEIQALRTKDAAELLVTIARDDDYTQRTIILCRMLFAPKANGALRPPIIGRPVFLGGTRYQDWLLEPIELVDGVPFLVVWGYLNSGYCETADSYVGYCLENCDWNPIRYAGKSAADKQAALEELLASPKWKEPLNADHQEFLSAQIK